MLFDLVNTIDFQWFGQRMGKRVFYVRSTMYIYILTIVRFYSKKWNETSNHKELNQSSNLCLMNVNNISLALTVSFGFIRSTITKNYALKVKNLVGNRSDEHYIKSLTANVLSIKVICIFEAN